MAPMPVTHRHRHQRRHRLRHRAAPGAAWAHRGRHHADITEVIPRGRAGHGPVYIDGDAGRRRRLRQWHRQRSAAPFRRMIRRPCRRRYRTSSIAGPDQIASASNAADGNTNTGVWYHQPIQTELGRRHARLRSCAWQHNAGGATSWRVSPPTIYSIWASFENKDARPHQQPEVVRQLAGTKSLQQLDRLQCARPLITR